MKHLSSLSSIMAQNEPFRPGKEQQKTEQNKKIHVPLSINSTMKTEAEKLQMQSPVPRVEVPDRDTGIIIK